MNTTNKPVTTYDYESMRDRLADNDACNYAQGYDTNTLYKIMREGIKGYDNMTDDELVSVHFDVFGYVDYKWLYPQDSLDAVQTSTQR